MKTTLSFFSLIFCLNTQLVVSQVTIDSTQINKEYKTIEEAIKNPEKVYRLNLSNQKLNLNNTDWSKFVNLEFLSFKNDHLQEIPEAIGFLKNLKVLDLSGNDFKILPKSIGELSNLEVLYLNDEKKLKLSENIDLISQLPHLKELHLENDNLKELPKNIYKLTSLETLFLNNNKFREIPIELKGLNHLQYLDFRKNEIKPELRDLENVNFGFKIKL
jgi:hypothetical protein